VLMAQRRFAEAERHLLSGYAEMVRCQRPVPPGEESPLARADRVIAQLYQRWGKPEKARAWADRPEPAPPPRRSDS
jgi:uncharacterized protein (DUF2384 family)